MKLVQKVAALPLLGLAVSMAACNPNTPTDPTLFGFSDDLGNYALTLSPKAYMKSAYSSGPGVQSSVDPAVVYGVAPAWKTVTLSYDPVQGTFSSQTDTDQTPTLIPSEDISAVDQNGLTVPFDPAATKLKSVTLTAQIGAEATATVSNGCQTSSAAMFTLTLTKGALAGSLYANYGILDVGSKGSSDPLIGCKADLADAQALISSGKDDAMNLRIFVDNGAADITRLQDLVSLGAGITFTGVENGGNLTTKSLEVGSPSESDSELVLKSGPIAKFHLKLQ